MSTGTQRRRPVILVTGFGPFPGAPRNASSDLAEELARVALRQLPGYRVQAAILPTEWHEGPRQLGLLLDEHDPVVAVHFGVSRRAKGFVIEMRARNEAGQVCDATGAMPPGTCVAYQGPAELAALMPTALIVARLRRLGLPVQASRDAGTYLCNAVLYSTLADARRRAAAGLRRGFVHLPDRLAPADARMSGTSRRSVPSQLDWEGAVTGGLAILSACVGANERAMALG